MRTLVLFTDLYTSLDREAKFGLLKRNMVLFEELLAIGRFDQVLCFTYDDRDRTELSRLIREGELSEKIDVLTPPLFLRSRLGSIIYSLVGPLLHYRKIAAAEVLRTAQVSGSWTALIAKLITGRPLLFRLGYPLSIRFQTEGKPLKRRIARLVELLLTRFSDHVCVSSRAMKDYYGRVAGQTEMTVLPSYVDLRSFTPITDYDPGKPVLFVGRLEPVKNIENLIRACGRLGLELHIYGRGSLEDELKALAQDCGAKVAFKGTLPNKELAKVHHLHSIYVLCSTREGMPKSLIEAMASGLVCISTATDGGCELIEDGRTGHLIQGFDANAIERKLKEVTEAMDPAVGRNASAIVRKTNSLDHAIEVELAILDKLVRPARYGRKAMSSTAARSLRR